MCIRDRSWPGSDNKAILPTFDWLSNQSYYIDVFNRGNGSFRFKARANKSWVKLSQTKGTVEKDARIQVSIDWGKLPFGESEAMIEIVQKQVTVPVYVHVVKTELPKTQEPYWGNLANAEFSIPANQDVYKRQA